MPVGAGPSGSAILSHKSGRSCRPGGKKRLAESGFERRYDVDAVEDIDTGVLMAMEYAYPGRVTEVEYHYPEFTSVCPWSGLPDFGELIIRYLPDRHLVEMKSLKYYLHSYRNVGILQEHAVNRVLDDLVAAINPLRLEVEGRFNARGGMSTVARAVHQRPRPQQP